MQENEAERTLYKAMTQDQTLPLDIRLQVCERIPVMFRYNDTAMQPMVPCNASSKADYPLAALHYDAAMQLDLIILIVQVQRLFETEMPRDAAANRIKNRESVCTQRDRVR